MRTVESRKFELLRKYAEIFEILYMHMMLFAIVNLGKYNLKLWTRGFILNYQ